MLKKTLENSRLFGLKVCTVRLSSIGFRNRTQSNSHTIFLVRLFSLPNSIEPNRSIKFDYRTVRVVSTGIKDMDDLKLRPSASAPAEESKIRLFVNILIKQIIT